MIKRTISRVRDFFSATKTNHNLRAVVEILMDRAGYDQSVIQRGASELLAEVVLRHPKSEDILTVSVCNDLVKAEMRSVHRVTSFERIGDNSRLTINGQVHSLEHISRLVATFTEATEKALDLHKRSQ